MTPSSIRPTLNEEAVLVMDLKSSDGAGGWAAVPVDVETIWMEIRPLSGQELARLGLVDTKDAHRARMRYRDDITRDWRVRRTRDNKEFEISAPPREIVRGRWIELDLVGH